MNSYVLCVRNVTKDADSGLQRFGSELGNTSYLQIPWSTPPSGDPPSDIPGPEHRLGKVTPWLQAIVEEAKVGRGPGEELDVVFYVHGYNTSPQEALKRQRLAEQKLRKRNFPCIVIGFDWPTGGTSVAYLYDRLQAGHAALRLVSDALFPFALFSTADCPIKVHVMAHSMGGYVVREAFNGADDARRASIPNDWSIGQMVLFGADLSSESFSEGHPDMKAVFRHSGRLTNYFSPYDEALAVSNVKNLDISSRVGRVGMPVDKPTSRKAIDVNCGPRYMAVQDRTFRVINGMVSHSWYMEDDVWYDDLAHTLSGDLDRNVIPTRVPDPGGLGDDFVLKAE